MAYSILEANMERLEKKLTRIQNKCKKFGCSFTYEKVGEEFKTLKDDRGVEYQAKFILIEAEGKAVLNDWMFVASVQHTEKGNIINSTGCSIEVPERYYTSEPICEHCNSRTVLVDNQTLDAFKTTGYEINNLVNGQTYYFALFPYADTGATNINEANRVAGTPQPYKKMTAIIDLSNSNPATCVTYADDAVGMTAGDSAWDEFFGHYPVLLKNGVEVGKLNPNNFDQFEDGTTADISSGNAGDAMIAFPRRGLTITTSGTKITISMTDDPDNADFEYNAHTRGTTPKDKELSSMQMALHEKRV